MSIRHRPGRRAWVVTTLVGLAASFVVIAGAAPADADVSVALHLGAVNALAVDVAAGKIFIAGRTDPIGTDGFGSGFISPLASRLNCMKTKFQISTYRPHSHGNVHSVWPSFEDAGPISKNISLHRPHGPVSPIAQKLSFSPGIATTRSAGAPVAFHKSAASASTPTPSPTASAAPNPCSAAP